MTYKSIKMTNFRLNFHCTNSQGMVIFYSLKKYRYLKSFSDIHNSLLATLWNSNKLCDIVIWWCVNICSIRHQILTLHQMCTSFVRNSPYKILKNNLNKVFWIKVIYSWWSEKQNIFSNHPNTKNSILIKHMLAQVNKNTVKKKCISLSCV